MKLAKAEAFLQRMKGSHREARLGLSWSNWKARETWGQILGLQIMAVPLLGWGRFLSLGLFPCNVRRTMPVLPTSQDRVVALCEF